MDLLADIGGTNARVAFREAGITGTVHLRRTADFPSLAALLADVIRAAGVTPARAALAVAGPITGDDVTLTNLPWRFSAKALAAALGVREVILENDVAAVAWALMALDGSHATALTPAKPASGARVVVAPGTGLGVSALAPRRHGGWTAIASEGSHAGLALPPSLPQEDRALLQARNGGWSWEDLVSGVGLPRLYHALGGGPELTTPEAVTVRAERGEPLAARTLDMFSLLLGAFAGDAVLMFAARGGCILAGGLLGSIGDLFKPGLFLEGFRDKDRFSGFMAEIPVYRHTHPQPALAGLGVLLDQNT